MARQLAPLAFALLLLCFAALALADEAAPAAGDGAASTDTNTTSTVGDGAPPATAAGNDAGDGGKPEDPNAMTPPPLTSDMLAGLLVAAVCFAIFLPGFLCLWNIQTPKSFAPLDAPDMKKKVQ